MEFPNDILTIIKEYSKPIGLRLDWKRGSYIKRHLLLDLESELYNAIHNMYRLINIDNLQFIYTTYDYNMNLITIIN